jgi:hypothetical protein
MITPSSLHRWLSTARQVAFAYLLLTAPRFRAATVSARFTALFNGRDFTGWRGGATYDQLRELPDAWMAKQTQLADELYCCYEAAAGS